MTKRRIALIGLASLAGLVALTAVVVLLWFWRASPIERAIVFGPVVPRPKGELLSNLDPSYAQGQHQIEARLATRFPIGAPEAELAAYLQAQGLKPHAPSPDHPGRRTYSAQWGRAVCSDFVSVSWTANERGKRQDLLVVFGATNCP